MLNGVIGNKLIGPGGGGGGGVPSGAVAQFDMSDGTSFTAAGRLTEWQNIATPDVPPLINNANSSTNPLYNDFGPAATINGVTVGRFYGRFMNTTASVSTLLQSATGFSAFIVGRIINTDGGPFFTINAGGNARIQLEQNGNGSIRIRGRAIPGDALTDNSGAVSAGTDAMVLGFRFDPSAATVRITKDGVAHLPDTAVTVGASAFGSDGASELILGSPIGCNYEFAEVLIFDTALNNTDMLAASTALATKWGI